MKISIVIPTRERADTLRSSLRTCVEQNADNLEIVVADNCSKDSTREVISSFRDERIRHVTTECRVGMSQNWENGLANATGDYVMFLGDDDGMLPGAVNELTRLLRDYTGRIFQWRPATYNWESGLVPSNRCRLAIPWDATSAREMDGETVLADAMSGRRPFYELPLPYFKALVSMEAIRAFKRVSARAIHSRTPDVYLGTVIASCAGKYTISEKVLSIAGSSHHSNGASTLHHDATRDAESLYLSEDNLPFHPELEYTQAASLLLWECILQARDHYGISPRMMANLDESRLLEQSVQQVSAYPPERYRTCMGVLERLADRKGLRETFQQAKTKYTNSTGGVHEDMAGYNIRRRQLVVDCSGYPDRSIYGASHICAAALLMRTQKILDVSIPTALRVAVRKTWRKLRGNY